MRSETTTTELFTGELFTGCTFSPKATAASACDDAIGDLVAWLGLASRQEYLDVIRNEGPFAWERRPGGPRHGAPL